MRLSVARKEGHLMKTRNQLAVFPQRQYRSGLFLLIAAPYVSLLVSIPFDPPRVAVLVGLRLLYSAVGLFALGYCSPPSSRPIMPAYFDVISFCVGPIP